MSRMMQERWELSTGDKEGRTGVDGVQQVGRNLSLLDSGATEEEEEEEEKEEEEEEEEDEEEGGGRGGAGRGRRGRRGGRRGRRRRRTSIGMGQIVSSWRSLRSKR